MHKISLLVAATIVLAAATGARAGHFSASDVPAARIRQPGKIVIRNDDKAITAFRFFENVRQALVTLRSARINFTPFGKAVYDSSARVTRPMPEYLSAIMNEAGAKHGVDPRLLAAVAQRESRLDASAVSHAGALGIMQLMPTTAHYLGVSNAFDARENVMAGAHYLRTLLDTFHGDLDLTLAAYNAGPGAVQRFNGVPPYAETRAYVKSIRANYEKSIR